MVSKFLTAIVSGLAVVFVAGAAHANLLLNGDFEITDGSVGLQNGLTLSGLQNGGANSWDVYSSIPGWSSDSGPGIEIQRNTVISAQSGSHYVELESHPGPNSASNMFQNFIAPVTTNYTLDFYYSPRVNTPGQNVINVLVDGALQLTVSGPPNPPFGQWSFVTLDLGVLLSGVSYRIEFNADGTIDNTLGGFLDNIRLTADKVSTDDLPAPAPLLLIIAGLVGLSMMRRHFAS